MSIIMKLTNGNEFQKSRFHDEKGNLIDLPGLKYLPNCLITTALRLSIGYRPILPWIGYRAMKRIKTILKPETTMLEFGSGMSTIWFSKQCNKLISIEDNEQWHKKIANYLKKGNITNVEYKLRPPLQYSNLDAFEDNSFDFIMIDGSERASCVRSSIPKLKQGGFIYLDNSDKSANDPNGDVRIAENLLLEAVKERKGVVEYFVDFVPTYFMVTQGMLVQL